MAVQQVKINGTTIKRPLEFRIERYKISTLERISDGSMVGDFIARKRTFHFGYPSINGTELDAILDLLWETNEMFATLTWIENNVEHTTTVYPGAIPQQLHHTGSQWVWQDIKFQLIEQ